MRQDEIAEVKSLYKVKCLTNMRWIYMNLYMSRHKYNVTPYVGNSYPTKPMKIPSTNSDQQVPGTLYSTNKCYFPFEGNVR